MTMVHQVMFHLFQSFLKPDEQMLHLKSLLYQKHKIKLLLQFYFLSMRDEIVLSISKIFVLMKEKKEKEKEREKVKKNKKNEKN